MGSVERTNDHGSRFADRLAAELREHDGYSSKIGPYEAELRHQYRLLTLRAQLEAGLQRQAQEVRAKLPGVSDLFEEALRARGSEWPDLLRRLRLDRRQVDRFRKRQASLLAVSPESLARAACELGVSAEALTLAAAKELSTAEPARPVAFRLLKGRKGQSSPESDDVSRDDYLVRLWLAFNKEPVK